MFRKPVKHVKFSEPYLPDKEPEDNQLTKQLKQQYRPGMFNQNVTVNVTIEEKDDGVADCIKGCFSACIGAGKKAAIA